MDLRHISRSEIIAAVGGLLLALGVFLPWYVPNTDNRNANVNGAREAVSAFDTYSIMRWLLLAAAVAPIVLLYIVIRDQANPDIAVYYAHLSSRDVTVGQHVDAGQTIGRSGNTGNSRGPHLHYEIRIKGNPVNPMPVLARNGVKP